jgi:hypothetical protein
MVGLHEAIGSNNHIDPNKRMGQSYPRWSATKGLLLRS